MLHIWEAQMVSQATGLDGIIYSKSNNRNSRPWAKASTWPVVIFINNLLLEQKPYPYFYSLVAFALQRRDKQF